MTPRRRHRVCNQPGCNTLTLSRKCNEHAHHDQLALEPTDENAQRRALYNTTRWRRFSRAYRQEHGTCAQCGNDATLVDHVDPITEILARGGDPLDPDECQPLCHQCSGRKDGARTPRARR